MRKSAFVIACLMFALISGAFAQDAYLGPQVGFYKATSADNAKIMGGAALRIRLGSTLGVEGSINYRQESYDGDRVTVRSYPFMVTGLWYVIPIVYGAIGAGWYNTRFEYNADKIGLNIPTETKQQFGWHFGAGADLPIGFGRLTGDVRYVFLNYDFKQVPGTSGLKANFFLFTVGVLFEL